MALHQAQSVPSVVQHTSDLGWAGLSVSAMICMIHSTRQVLRVVRAALYNSYCHLRLTVSDREGISEGFGWAVSLVSQRWVMLVPRYFTLQSHNQC